MTRARSEEGFARLPNLPPEQGGAGEISEGASTAPSEASPRNRVAPAKPALEKAGARSAPITSREVPSRGSLAAATLTESVKALALELGFDRVAIGPAGPPEHGPAFRRWVEAGHAGTMAYLERRTEERLDPERLLPGALSIVCVALNYYQGEADDPSWEPVARYAWGRDYHDVITPRLERLGAYLRDAGGARCRAYVDTGPVLEREVAARAGLGWIGKNTMLLHPALGSWFFIGVLLTTAELEHDAPLPDRCGSCRACLDVCPTQAFVAPYVLDARRCVSYLTIEHRGAIDPALHEGVGRWQFGCDLCQSVCPWNRKAPLTREPAFLPAAPYPGAEAVLEMSDAEFRREFAGTALLRPRAAGMRRNVAVALDNARRASETPDQPGRGAHGASGLPHARGRAWSLRPWRCPLT